MSPAGGAMVTGEFGLPVADSPADLTAGWLTDALHHTGHAGATTRVSDVEIASVGTGQMSGSVRLSLTYDGPEPGPGNLVAKLPSADETSRATALALGSYENEVRFYQQLAQRLPIRTPRCFYADIDVPTASFVLLLEDLSPARVGDQIAGCNVEEAAVAVGELVKLHSPLWADPELAGLPWLHRDRTMQQQFLLGALPQFWAGFRERYADRLGDEVHEAGGALFDRLEAYILEDTSPWTVVHGDYRLDNLLFGGAGGRPTVAAVDWQTCTHGPALQDVAYFVGAGLLAEDRRKHEPDLVRAYHSGLLEAGVSGYTWEACWRDYRRGTWSGLVMAVAASMLVERTARGDEMFMVMAHRHALHALDLEAADAIGRPPDRPEG